MFPVEFFIFATKISMLWAIIGIPTAILLLIIRATKKEKFKKDHYNKFILISLAGIPIFLVLILVFAYYVTPYIVNYVNVPPH